MKKDIITVKTKDGSLIDMELVAYYEDQKENKNYIIYKNLDNDMLYLAKYKKDNNIYKMNTDLTKEEIIKMEYIFNKYVEMENNYV